MTDRSLAATLTIIWCVAALIVTRVTRDDSSTRTPDVFPNMFYSPAFEAQEPNPVFADGRTLRPPVPGAIARGFMPFPYGVTVEEGKRAGAELINPFKPEPAVLARGERVYRAWCAACHGPGGAGDGAVTRRGVPPPPSLMLDNAMNMKDGEMYHLVTLGRNNMPAHAGQVAREDRWKAILHVRQLQGVSR